MCCDCLPPRPKPCLCLLTWIAIFIRMPAKKAQAKCLGGKVTFSSRTIATSNDSALKNDLRQFVMSCAPNPWLACPSNFAESHWSRIWYLQRHRTNQYGFKVRCPGRPYGAICTSYCTVSYCYCYDVQARDQDPNGRCLRTYKIM